MRYYAMLEGRQRTVDVEPIGGSRFRVSIDGGEPRLVDAERLEAGTVNVLIEHRSYDIDLEEDGEGFAMLVADELFRLEILDERRMRLREAKGKFSVEGPQVIRAPMPGKVVKVLVEAGAEVTEGQGIVVIEAMKMENELRATKNGTVAAILVKEGQTVEGGTELARIE